MHAYTTTRLGGVSQSPYDSLNLGDHVDDDRAHVLTNRRRLIERLDLPSEPCWLNQVHGTDVIELSQNKQDTAPEQADASITKEVGVVCAVLTADCLPLLICNTAGTRIAAAHAGWRGLAAGVIEATIKSLEVSPNELLVWMGPAIGPQAFAVGDEVREAFISQHPEHGSGFKEAGPGRWWADIYILARQRLESLGVNAIYGGHWCTYGDVTNFYSYRRDGVTGRMANLIWMSTPD